MKSRSGGAQSPSDMARARTGNEDIHQPLGALLQSEFEATLATPISARSRSKMKSARPVSAQAQNGASLGSGEISERAEAGTSSASSRSRLTIFPVRWTPDA